jgi:carbon-monoxide dehydrogenase medium subunit
VSADEFFLGVYMTAVAQGELLTTVTVPPPGGGDAFESVTIGRDGTCIVSAAATLDGQARVAIGCVAAVPVLVTAAPEEEAVREAVTGAVTDPPSDVHASAEYRRHLAGVLAARAVRKATG